MTDNLLIKMKRFQLFNKWDNDYIIDMEYALGYDDPNVDFSDFVGQALTSEEIVNTLNKQQSKIEQLEKEIAYHQKKHHTAFMDGRDMGIREVEDALEKIKRYE